MIQLIAATFVVALIAGFFLVPVLKRIAHQVGLVDRPDQTRKLHRSDIPLIGGLAICAAALVALVAIAIVYRETLAEIDIDYFKLGGLLIACLLILAVGVIDDRFALKGRQKLIGQLFIATVLILFGFRFDSIGIYGTTLDLELFSIIVVYAWILVGINSVNLLDGADGFATTIGLLMSVALCVMAFHMRKYDDAIVCAAMAGALLAFMRFNFPPATAYLGDAGSMLIGLFIAGMAIKCASKEAAAYAFLAPIALLAIPMFDTIAAIVRRRLTGRSIYTTDRGHLHHQLIGKGFGPRRALLLFCAMCLMTATGGTLSLIYRQAEYAIMSIIAVIVFLFVGRVFGFAEYKLITNRSASLVRSFLTKPERQGHSHHASVRLQGERNWDLCWQVLREFAENNQLSRMTMDLNLPWLHESFHANFSSPDRKIATEEQWSVELPLVISDRVIGRINLQGCVTRSPFVSVMGELNEILVSLESYFIETIESHLPRAVEDATNENDSHSVEFDPRPTKPRALDVG